LNICPHVQIEIFPEFINPKNAINIITQYDVVVDGTDNFDARYLISDACSALQKPLVYASIEGFQIQLSVFSYQKGHTLRCLFPERHDAPTCADNGVMSPVTQLAGNLQAMEVLKIVSGNGKVSEGVLKMVDVLNGEVSNFQFKKSDFPEQYSVKKFQEFYHCSSEMKSITVQELKEWMDSGKEFQLIDVREPEEWAICQLDSIQIPLGKLMQKVNDLDETMPTVLLCHHGFRSAQAAGLLLQHDFQEVYNLKGGIHQWAVQIDTSMQTY
jgi:sulfur-carrier protein adenylyltransferase/sulfurtransferase